MKAKNSISHFKGREQEAILRLKNKIARLYKPEIIYFIGSKSTTHLNRNCFSNPKNEDSWNFSCDLLVIMPDGAAVPENAPVELNTAIKKFDKIQIIVQPLGFVVQQLKEQSLFYCWIQRWGIILYQKEDTLEKLPAPLANIRQYTNVVHEFYKDNPTYENHNAVKLTPMPVENTLMDQDLVVSEPAISHTLQTKLADFLDGQGAKNINVQIRKVVLEYVLGVTDSGVPSDLDYVLYLFEELMEIFDLAEKEFES